VGALASLIGGLATGETLAAIQRTRRALIAYLIAGALGLFGLIYLLVAGTIWASHRYGAVEATLVIGAAFIVLALLVFIVHKMTAGRRAISVKTQRKRDLSNAAIAAAIAAAPALLRGRTGVAALVLPAVAFLAYTIYRENTPRDPSDPPPPA
jgi:hypothetical protein